MIIGTTFSGRGQIIMTHKYTERHSIGWEHYHRVIKERWSDTFSWQRQKACEQCKKRHHCKVHL